MTGNKSELTNKIKLLVKARLSVLPPDSLISIGSYGYFTKNELISHIDKNDTIGQAITEIELEYLRSLKKGFFYA